MLPSTGSSMYPALRLHGVSRLHTAHTNVHVRQRMSSYTHHTPHMHTAPRHEGKGKAKHTARSLLTPLDTPMTVHHRPCLCLDGSARVGPAQTEVITAVVWKSPSVNPGPGRGEGRDVQIWSFCRFSGHD